MIQEYQLKITNKKEQYADLRTPIKNYDKKGQDEDLRIPNILERRLHATTRLLRIRIRPYCVQLWLVEPDIVIVIVIIITIIIIVCDFGL